MTLSIHFHHLKHFIMDDPLCDYLDLHKETHVSREVSSFTKDLAKSKQIYLHKFKAQLQALHPVQSFIGHSEVRRCLRDKERVLLFQPTLFHPRYKVYVKPDLLMHRDIFHQIFTEVTHPVPEYVAVDILYKILHFNADQSDLLNQGSLRYHKCKMAYVSMCLTEMGCTHINEGYVFGKEYRHKGLPLVKKQCIGYVPLSSDYKVDIQRAVTWIHRLTRNHHTWVLFPQPSVRELYPNMNHKNEVWQHEKQGIAEVLKEITLVWSITLKQRNHLMEKGITEWDDPLLLGKIYPYQVKDNHRHTIQDKMIHLNQQEEIKISPRKIKDREFRDILLNQTNSIILDIESVIQLDEKESYFEETPPTESPTICIIGTILNEDMFRFKDFTIKFLTLDEEETIIRHWCHYLTKYFKGAPIKVYHWGHAEVTYVNYMKQTYPDIPFPTLEMIDLLHYFRKEPITIKGCFGYGLKEIVNTLYNLDLIESQWEGDLSGLDALQEIMRTSEIAKIQNVPIKRFAEIRKIIYYNYIDCRVLVDLLGLLLTLC
jgi:hypothetical protein